MFVLPINQDLTDVEGFWQLSCTVADEMPLKSFSKVYSEYSFGEMLRLVTMYYMLPRYAGLSDCLLPEHDLCDFDRQSFAKTICEFFLFRNRKKTSSSPRDIVFTTNKTAFKVSNYHGSIGPVVPDGVIATQDEDGIECPFVWIDIKHIKPKKDAEQHDTNTDQENIGKIAIACLALAQKRSIDCSADGYTVSGIEFCGCNAAFWKATFSHEYLVAIKRSPTLPANSYVLLKRSKILDLVESDHRKEFAGHFIAMLYEIENSQV